MVNGSDQIVGSSVGEGPGVTGPGVRVGDGVIVPVEVKLAVGVIEGVQVAVDVRLGVSVGVGVSVANREIAGTSDPSNQ
jgi:hypothetical protein